MEAFRRSAFGVGLTFCVPLAACGSSTQSDGETAKPPSDDPGFYLIGPSDDQLRRVDSLATADVDVLVDSISDDGLVAVGNSYVWSNVDPETSSYIGFRWTRETGTVSLGSLPTDDPFNPPFVSKMTPDGSVLVGATNSAMAGSRPFRWTKSGMVDITPAEGRSGAAAQLNEDGSVAGGYFRLPPSEEHMFEQAFVWTKARGSFALENLPGDFGGRVGYVSRDGSIVAGVSLGDGGAFVRSKLFRWTEATGTTAVESPPGCDDFTISISEPPFMAGYCRPLEGTDGQSYLWHEETGLVLLGSPPGRDGSMPYAMSRDGSFLVGPATIGGSFADAFRWSRATGANETLAVPGFQSVDLLVGTRIMSDDGSVVVGTASNPNVASLAAFRWTPESFTLLDALPGDAQVSVNGVSGDGRLIAGSSSFNSDSSAVVWTTGGPTRIEDYIVENGFNAARVSRFGGIAPTHDGNLLYGTASLVTGGSYGWLLKLPDAP